MSTNVALTLPNMTINGYTATLTLSGESGAELVRILKDMQAAGMTQAVPVSVAAPVIPLRCVLSIASWSGYARISTEPKF